ncbi:MAG: hypothetical protein QNK37_24805 [Acidobacteriota bacterium]|nr:hypothetical protein [Acidobacteriota bacterium]
MQSQGKVARYLQAGKKKPSQESQPQVEKITEPEEDKVVEEQPIEVDESLFQHSLTPTNVLKKIHRDIVRVIGIRPGYNGKFTTLEQKMINSLEKVVRKGNCPSLVYKDADLRVAFECLASFFDNARVTLNDGGISAKTTEVPVFSSLLNYAREASYLEKQIKEARSQVSKQPSPALKSEFKNKVDTLKAKKDNCLIMYQKIVFSDAETLQAKRKQRQVSLFGKPCTLDDLISFFRKGGSTKGVEVDLVEVDDAGLGDPLDNKPPTFTEDPDYLPPVRTDFLDETYDTGTNLNFPGVMDKDDLSISFDDNSQDEVVDWIQIKKQGKR